jgi:hypothetical protein
LVETGFGSIADDPDTLHSIKHMCGTRVASAVALLIVAKTKAQMGISYDVFKATALMLAALAKK